MKASEIAPYLEAGDAVLLHLGFTRKKKCQEWRRAVDATEVEWIHLNFGLAVINPSFGVLYSDLDAHFLAEVGTKFGTMVMLSSISGKGYTSNDLPTVVASALLLAVPELEKHRNRSLVIDALKSDVPTAWPLVGRSARMRCSPAPTDYQRRSTGLLASSRSHLQATRWSLDTMFSFVISERSMRPNQALQHNDPSCHVSCLRTPRASRGRG